jgi:hypothetical protein
MEVAATKKSNTAEKARLEIKNYQALPSIPLNSSPHTWWKEKAASFPMMAKFARFALCIPATSVASERVFSTAGDVISAKRANLTSSNADQLIFLHHNLK